MRVYYMEELEDGNRKMAVSMILCEALTSREGETSSAWSAAQKKIAKYKPFDDPLFMDLLELVFRKLRKNFVEIDRDFILELGSLSICALSHSWRSRNCKRGFRKNTNHDRQRKDVHDEVQTVPFSW